MTRQITFRKLTGFPLTKIVIGILVVIGSVALAEWLIQSIFDNVKTPDELKDAVTGITEAILALLSYQFLYRLYEKRQIKELSLASFGKGAGIGFLGGLILQSLVILVVYLAGGYSVLTINPFTFLIPNFTAALTAGFVAEILIRGILFRITEEKLGTVIALIISVLLFAIVHSGVEGATLLSVLATSVQAGILFSAVYVFSRNLWFPIFLHFSWDFTEPGIYGGINPGINTGKSLFTSTISGPGLLTGGQFGPGNSIQSVLFCLAASLLFLWLAKQNNNFIKPYWKR